MAKDKISITVDADVLAALDAHAAAEGLNRSEAIEQALRNEQLRLALAKYKAALPTSGIPEYLEMWDRANLEAGL